MDLSVIIVNWNTRELVEACIESIFEETRGISFEVIVVDNGSEDGSQASIERRFPCVVLIENRLNVGYSKANNQGIEESSGRYVCLLNSDTVVIDNALGKLVEFLDERPKAGAASSLLMNPDGSFQIGSALGETNLLYMISVGTGLYELFPESRTWGKPFLSYLDHSRMHEVEVCPSAAVAVRREVFADVGLLDECIFFGTVDWDFSYRMRRNGWELYHFPESKVIHYGGKSKGPIEKELMDRDYRSRYHYFRKHYGVLQMNIFRVMTIMFSSSKMLFSLLILLFGRHDQERVLRERDRFTTHRCRLKVSLSSIDLPNASGEPDG